MRDKAWGSDLKYHVHVHCLVTFGGLTAEPKREWRWPRQKDKLAPYRKICGRFREVFLAGLKCLMDQGEVVYHRSFEDIEDELLKVRWVVHNTRPTADTKVIEEYLGRYTCLPEAGLSDRHL